MKIRTFMLGTAGIMILSAGILASCQKESMTSQVIQDEALNTQSAPNLKAGNYEMPGRALAANCFQCHGTNGYAGELKIAGQSASGIISELNEMKAKDPRSNIMNVHARGYTDEQIKLIADYISKQ